MRNRPILSRPTGDPEQMAAFLNRAFDLAPAPAAGFVDTENSFAALDIDALYASGITRGCAVDPLRFCPDMPTTRAQWRPSSTGPAPTASHNHTVS